jgi:hypothetical protein
VGIATTERPSAALEQPLQSIPMDCSRECLGIPQASNSAAFRTKYKRRNAASLNAQPPRSLPLQVVSH